jgi:uncharacterized protein (DUF342 family)
VVVAAARLLLRAVSSMATAALGLQRMQMTMEQDETPLERAQRHVLEAEARVAAQVAWIAELTRLRYDTAADEIALAVLKDELQRLYKVLDRERRG